MEDKEKVETGKLKAEEGPLPAPIYISETVKPGVQTSEFYITALTVVAATVLVAMGKIGSGEWLAVLGLNGGIYTAARSFLKRG